MRVRLASTLISLLCFDTGCVTEHYAALRNTPSATVGVSNCLASIGFSEDSQLFDMVIGRDPELVAVWSMPSRSRASRAPGTTAWVKAQPGQLRVRLLPGVGEDNDGTTALARSFESCIAEHVPSAEITMTSATTPDLR